MKYPRFLQGLLGLVILFYFSACDSTGQLGLELQSDIVARTFFTDTLTVQTEVLFMDSIPTTIPLGSNIAWLIGKNQNEFVGLTHAHGYANLLLPLLQAGEIFDFDETASFDSATLQLNYAVNIGDPNASLTFSVYELDRGLDSGVVYYQTNSLPYNPDPIGSAVFSPSASTDNILRIPVNELGAKIFEESRRTPLTDDTFEPLFPGIAIRAEGEGTGFIISARPPDQSFTDFNIRIYYSSPGDTLARFRTVFFGSKFHQIEKDFTGTPLEGLEYGQSKKAEELDDRLFFQFSAGLIPRFSFPTFRAFNQDNTFLINRAEFLFDPIPEAVSALGAPPSALSFIAADPITRVFGSRLLGSPLALTNELTGGPVSLNFNPNAQTYPTVRITRYFQDMLNGRVADEGFLFAIFVIQDQRTGLGRIDHSTRPLVFKGPNADSPERLRLKLYYTLF